MKVQEVIKALGDTNWGADNKAQMKAVQLLKGIALSDEAISNKFMKALSDASTGIAKKLLSGGGDKKPLEESISSFDIFGDNEMLEEAKSNFKGFKVMDFNKLPNLAGFMKMTPRQGALISATSPFNGKEQNFDQIMFRLNMVAMAWERMGGKNSILEMHNEHSDKVIEEQQAPDMFDSMLEEHTDVAKGVQKDDNGEYIVKNDVSEDTSNIDVKVPEVLKDDNGSVLIYKKAVSLMNGKLSDGAFIVEVKKQSRLINSRPLNAEESLEICNAVDEFTSYDSDTIYNALVNDTSENTEEKIQDSLSTNSAMDGLL